MLKEKICTTNWSVLPAPIWFLIASPLLSWAMGPDKDGRWFHWPHGCSYTPLHKSFWRVELGE